MDKKQKAEIKEKIRLEIIKTEKTILEYREMTRPIAPDCAIGRVSRMDSIVTMEITKSALRKKEEKLSSLKYAEQQISNKNFGLCAKCGGSIPIGRIMLMPQSRFCVKCAS